MATLSKSEAAHDRAVRRGQSAMKNSRRPNCNRQGGIKRRNFADGILRVCRYCRWESFIAK